jgi:Ferritin-like
MDEGLTPEELDAVTRWCQTIAHVATEEMLHLALVQNVLSAIGAAPHLTRPNLPAPAHHYPAAVNLTLVPFGEPALQHFLYLERPEGMALEGAKGIDAPVHDAVPLMAEGDIVPQLQDFATIGHLYRSIEQGVVHLADKFGERNLFVGPPRAQATSTEFRWPELVAVTDRASAQRALDTILEQGEGARGHWEAAHFGQFVEILAEYRRMIAANPAFDPVRPVMFAKVRRGEHDDSSLLIGDRVTAQSTDLFNVSYEILLQILERYFAHTEETDGQLATLAHAAVTLMGGVLRPLGALISTLPVGAEHPGRTAGPSFELFYEDDDLLPHRESAWALLEERLRDASTFCGAVANSSPEDVASALGVAEGADGRGGFARSAFRRLGRGESLLDRWRWVNDDRDRLSSGVGPGRAAGLRREHQATVSRARSRLDAFRLRPLVPRRRLGPRPRHPRAARGRHDATRRSVARGACRRLPPVDRRRQTRLGRRRRGPRGPAVVARITPTPTVCATATTSSRSRG